jgi:Mce-associated membrane protein
VGVAPRRFTDATVSGEPKDGLEDDTASRTQADTATAVEDDFASGTAPASGSAESHAAGESAGSADTDAAAEPAEDAADESVPEPRRRKRRPGRPRPRKRVSRAVSAETRRPMVILVAVFGVLVVALAGVAIKLGVGVAAQQRQQADQQAALQAGRQAAADLMTVSYQTSSSDINRILGIATGSFYSQVSGAKKQLINETDSAHAVSKANVLSAGLVGGQVNGNTATVIVVVDSTITSKNAPNGVVNHYRETITLNHTGGRWLASQVNFATPSGGQ